MTGMVGLEEAVCRNPRGADLNGAVNVGTQQVKESRFIVSVFSCSGRTDNERPLTPPPMMNDTLEAASHCFLLSVSQCLSRWWHKAVKLKTAPVSNMAEIRGQQSLESCHCHYWVSVRMKEVTSSVLVKVCIYGGEAPGLFISPSVYTCSGLCIWCVQLQTTLCDHCSVYMNCCLIVRSPLLRSSGCVLLTYPLHIRRSQFLGTCSDSWISQTELILSMRKSVWD